MSVDKKILKSCSRLIEVLALTICAASAQAQTIGLINTGSDINGVQLSGGVEDSRWSIVAGADISTPAAALVLTDQHPYNHYYSVSDSAWIWRTADGNAAVNTPYTFQMQFDLTGYDLNAVRISGYWGVDNEAVMSLNGATPVGSGDFSLPLGSVDNFDVSHLFSITSGFVPGVNYLQVQVTDVGEPGGLNVTGSIGLVSSVPEPSSAVLFAGGLAMIGRLARRKAAFVRNQGT